MSLLHILLLIVSAAAADIVGITARLFLLLISWLIWQQLFIRTVAIFRVLLTLFLLQLLFYAIYAVVASKYYTSFLSAHNNLSHLDMSKKKRTPTPHTHIPNLREERTRTTIIIIRATSFQHHASHVFIKW